MKHRLILKSKDESLQRVIGLLRYYDLCHAYEQMCRPNHLVYRRLYSYELHLAKVTSLAI